MAFSIDDRTTNSTDNRYSRHVQGGTTDIYNKRLGWWERRKILQQDDDFIITIREFEVGRPDLLSYRVYGKATYAWLVLQYNNIVDPITELVAGTTVRLPSRERLTLDIVTKPEGGNRIT